MAIAFTVLGTATPFRSAAPAGRSLRPRALTGIFTYGHNPAGRSSLKAVVVDEPFDWDDDAPPALAARRFSALRNSRQGATRQHPVPKHCGTYAGLASPPMIRHFRTLASPPSNCCQSTAFWMKNV